MGNYASTGVGMKKKQSNKFQRAAKKQKNLSKAELKKVSGGRYAMDPRRAQLYDEAFRSVDDRLNRGS
jgi:hypothetical protein